MPIFDFRCHMCDNIWEELTPTSEEGYAQRVCPGCGSNQVTKLISAASFKLKGTGWYETDFKDKGSSSNE